MIKQAIIPLAGLGTRLLPLTSVMPKELLPINGKPGSYRPMRYTFLIWVMVIVGGSGNNFGAVLGGFAVWFLWIEAAPIALFLINFFTSGLEETNAFRLHLIDSIPYFRFLMMGIGLLLIMRYRPKGIIPEKIRHV